MWGEKGQITDWYGEHDTVYIKCKNQHQRKLCSMTSGDTYVIKVILSICSVQGTVLTDWNWLLTTFSEQGSWYYYTPFNKEEAKAQRGWVPSPKLQGGEIGIWIILWSRQRRSNNIIRKESKVIFVG